MGDFEKIKNADILAKTQGREHVLSIAEAGLQAIDTKRAVLENVRFEHEEERLCAGEEECSLEGVDRIFVVGVGKCAMAAAEALEEKLQERLTGGIVLDVREDPLCTLKKIECFTGTHPYPSEANIAASKKILELLSGLTERDVVEFVISGGGSTLLCLPAEGATCVDEEKIVKALFKAGADIYAINTIRKHMSQVRGGFLAKHAYPARVISLIFSDVPGNDISFVASGPTVKDETTVDDAAKTLEKYGIVPTCADNYCGLIETPKDEKYFEKVTNIVLVSNVVLLDAMAKEAKRRGLLPKICSECLTGEARDVAKRVAEELHAADPGTVLLYGGETTVTIHGRSGSGGRNLELALSAVRFVRDTEVIAAVASDGRDNSEYAGALCDILTKNSVREHCLEIEEYLERNDALPFWRQVGDYIKTGDTGSNVSDFVIALKVRDSNN